MTSQEIEHYLAQAERFCEHALRQAGEEPVKYARANRDWLHETLDSLDDRRALLMLALARSGQIPWSRLVNRLRRIGQDELADRVDEVTSLPLELAPSATHLDSTDDFLADGQATQSQHRSLDSAVADDLLGETLKTYAKDPDAPPQDPGRAPEDLRDGESRDFTSELEASQSFNEDAWRVENRKLAKALGIDDMQISSGVSESESGSERALINVTKHHADLDTLRYLGAWQGIRGDQRSVLVFHPEKGGVDSVYELRIPEPDMQVVRSQLNKAGIPIRLIVPEQGVTRVIVYDQGRRLRDKVAQFAERMNLASIRETLGRAETLGGSSRAEARAEFRRIVAAFEADPARQVRRKPDEPGGDGRTVSREA